MKWLKVAAVLITNYYRQFGLVRAILFAPCIIFGSWFFLRVSAGLVADDSEKVESAKQRSAQIDNWTELKSDNSGKPE